MQNVPKIVRDRLQRSGSVPAKSHPDADLLTAFVERSLAAGQREPVLQHLAQCGDCREIVHLALSAPEVEAPTLFSQTRTGWLRWPTLRWVVVAAGILAVTSVGVLQFRQRQEKSLVAARLMPRDQLASAEQSAPLSLSTSAPPTSASSPPPEQAGKLAEMRKNAISSQALAADNGTAIPNVVFPRSNQFHGGVAGGIGAGSSVGAAVGGKLHRDVTPDRALAFAPAGRNADSAAPAKQNPPVPAASETVEVARPTMNVEVSGAAPMIQTEVAARTATQDQLVRNQAADKLRSSGGQVEAVVRAKPTLPQNPPAIAGSELQEDAALMKIPAPRWTISASGALQRSLDGGKTWLEVNLAADRSNLVEQSKSDALVAKSSRARTETKDAKYAPAPAPTAPVIFRALSVSSSAAEVWAGGSAGVLYHTMDGGNLWVRVVPSEAGVALTGDIVSIQFSDPRNGTVTTSNGAVWTTKDDGQSWRKQQ